jgi:hypothetical protein
MNQQLTSNKTETAVINNTTTRIIVDMPSVDLAENNFET